MKKICTVFLFLIMSIGFLQAQNIIVNGDFSAALASWESEEYNGSDLTLSAADSVAHITVEALGDNPWDGQFKQAFTADAGKYDVSFDIMASDSAVFNVFIQENGGGWATHDSKEFEATEEWQTITYTSAFLPGNQEVKLAFSLGYDSAGITYDIDNVSMTPVDVGITIDGNLDEFYTALAGPDDGYLQMRYFTSNQNGQADDDSDLSAKFYMAWDADWMYFYEEVMDDSVSATSTNTYENDVLEFKIDAIPVDGEAADNLFATSMTALDSAASAPSAFDDWNNIADSLKEFIRVQTETGYILEAKLAWSVLSGDTTINTAVGGKFGASIANHDNDGSATNPRESSIQWAAVLDDATWNNTSLHGTVEFLSDNKVKFIPSNNWTGVTNYLPYDGTEIITIDGELDPWYMGLTGPDDGYLQMRYFTSNQNGQADDDADLSAKFYASWDDNWFYFYEEVTDDTVSATSANTYENDVLEFKIDAVPVDGEAADNLFATSMTALDSTDSAPSAFDDWNNIADADKEFVRVKTETGYIIEAKLAWSALAGDTTINTTVGGRFGASIANHDNDGASRESSIQWAAVLDDATWNNTSLHGTVEFLADRKVKFIPTNNWTDVTNYLPYDGSDIIEIDGKMDQWYMGLTGPADGYLQIRHFASNQNGEADDDDDLSAKFYASWDNNWFYFYEEVTDDTVSATSANTYENDVLEFKIDAVPVDGEAADNLFATSMTALDSAASAPSAFDDWNNIADSLKEFVRVQTETGYILEAKLAWSALAGDTTINTSVGGKFGASIANHDNDGAGRESSIQWSAVLDDATWNNTSYHGTVEFLADRKVNFIPTNEWTGVTNEIPYDGSDWPVDAIEVDNNNLPTVYALRQNYPNPFNPTTTISYDLPKASEVELAIYDVLGRKVADLVNERQEAGVYKITVRASEYASGMYFYRIKAGNFVKSHKMILLK